MKIRPKEINLIRNSDRREYGFIININGLDISGKIITQYYLILDKENILFQSPLNNIGFDEDFPFHLKIELNNGSNPRLEDTIKDYLITKCKEYH